MNLFRYLGKTPQILLMERIELYLKKQGRDVTLSEGYCHGLALYWMYMKANGREDEFFRLVMKIASWDGVEDIDTSFEKFLSHIEWLQRHHYFLFHRSQADISKTLGVVQGKDDAQFFEDDYQFSAVFKKNEIVGVVKKLLRDQNYVLLSSHGHDVAVYLENDKYKFDDSNSMDGIHEFDTLAQLFDAKDGVIQSLLFREESNELIDVLSEAQKKLVGLSVPENFPLSIQVLRPSNVSHYDYPEPSELMQNMMDKRIKQTGSSEIEASGFKRQTGLILAAISKDSKSLDAYVKLGANIHAKDKDGKTALHHAALDNSPEICEYLIAHGADSDINVQARNGFTPLLYAAVMSNVEVGKYLIKNNADIFLKNNKGEDVFSLMDSNTRKELIPVMLQVAFENNDSKKFEEISKRCNNRTHLAEFLHSVAQTITNDKPLWVSVAEKNNSAMAIKLLEHDAPVRLKDIDAIAKLGSKDDLIKFARLKLFHDAIKTADKDIINQLLKEDPTLISATFSDKTALETVLESKQSEMIPFLFSQGAQKDFLDVRSRNYLQIALSNLDFNAIIEFVKAGLTIPEEEQELPNLFFRRLPDIDLTAFAHFIEKDLQKNPLQEFLTSFLFSVAVKKGDFNLVKQMLEKSPKLIDTLSEDNDTVLHLAAGSGNVELMEYLLSKLPEDKELVNIKNEAEQTPLHIAAEAGNLEMIKFLVGRGANIEALDCIKLTPLLGATKYNHQECITFLIDAGASVKHKSYVGNLINIAVSSHISHLIPYFAKLGTDPNEKPFSSESPFKTALADKDLSALKYLIEAGAKIPTIESSTIKNLILNKAISLLQVLADHNVPLEIDTSLIEHVVKNYPAVKKYWLDIFAQSAVTSGDLSLLQAILKENPNVNIVNTYNQSLLHLAAERGDINIVQFLLKQGAYVHAKADTQVTPLHLAIENGHGEVAKMLIANGANVNSKTVEGNTPLHLAALKKDEKTIGILLHSHADMEIKNNNRRTPLSAHPKDKMLDKNSKKESVSKEEANVNKTLLKELHTHLKNNIKSNPNLFLLLSDIHNISTKIPAEAYNKQVLSKLTQFKASIPKEKGYYSLWSQKNTLLQVVEDLIKVTNSAQGQNLKLDHPK